MIRLRWSVYYREKDTVRVVFLVRVKTRRARLREQSDLSFFELEKQFWIPPIAHRRRLICAPRIDISVSYNAHARARILDQIRDRLLGAGNGRFIWSASPAKGLRWETAMRTPHRVIVSYLVPALHPLIQRNNDIQPADPSLLAASLQILMMRSRCQRFMPPFLLQPNLFSFFFYFFKSLLSNVYNNFWQRI